MKKKYLIQIVLLAILFLLNLIVTPIIKSLTQIHLNSLFNIWFIIIDFLLLGIILSIPKFSKNRHRKINYLYLVLELLLIVALAFAFIFGISMELLVLTSCCIGYFIIDCISENTQL